jgi:FMN phosphatase YigB (HAD superfamily)
VHYFQRAFSELAKDTGAPADQIETAYLHFNNDVCRGVMSLSDYHAKLAERLGIDSVDWQAYYLAAIEPIERMQEVLVWASESYKVGLFTNIMPGFLSSMRRTGKIPNLKYDAIIDSSEVGAIKPDAKIYEIAQERAGVPPEEILLIDDDPFNLAAAERAGWKAISFDDARLEESITYVRQALEPAV